jgi:hypothetical protein
MPVAARGYGCQVLWQVATAHIAPPARMRSKSTNSHACLCARVCSCALVLSAHGCFCAFTRAGVPLPPRSRVCAARRTLHGAMPHAACTGCVRLYALDHRLRVRTQTPTLNPSKAREKEQNGVTRSPPGACACACVCMRACVRGRARAHACVRACVRVMSGTTGTRARARAHRTRAQTQRKHARGRRGAARTSVLDTFSA